MKVSIQRIAKSLGLAGSISLHQDFFPPRSDGTRLSLLERAQELSPAKPKFGKRMCRDLGYWLRRSLVSEPMNYNDMGPTPGTFIAADPDEWKKFLSKTPKPKSFFQVSSGISLLTLAGKAYSFEPGDDRLAAAQWINCHPFNVRYWSKSSGKWWPGGKVSFLPRFESPKLQVETYVLLGEGRAGPGRSFAVVWIPARPVLPAAA